MCVRYISLQMARLLACVAMLAAWLGVIAPNAVAAGGYYADTVWPAASPSLWYPSDTAVAMDGSVFVSDTNGGRIVVLDSSGTFVRSFSGSSLPWVQVVAPRSVTLGPDARLYVTDVATHRVHVFERDGTPVGSWGGLGSAHGEFLSPCGLSFGPDGSIFVADSGNNRVERFSPDGRWLDQIGRPGWGPGELNSPVGVAVAGDEVYVAEENGLRVQVFTPQGAVLREWGISGASGTTVSRYSRPSGIDVSTVGTVAVSDAGKRQIDTCSSTGSGSVFTPLSLGFGEGIMDSPGTPSWSGATILTGDRGNDRITRFDYSASAWLPSWEISRGAGGPDGVYFPRAAAFAADGSLLVADAGNDRIIRVNEASGYVGDFAVASPDGTLSAPAGLAVSPDGTRVFVSDTGRSRIHVFDAEGQHLRSFGATGTTAGRYSSPRGLAVMPNGDLVVADTGNHRVQVTDEWGTFKGEWGGLGSGDNAFNAPEGVAVSAQSEIFVADTGNHRVQVFNSVGMWQATFGGFGEAAGKFRFPSAIVVHPSGDLLVAERGGARVQRLSCTGAFKDSFGRAGAVTGTFRAPDGIAVDASGVVAVADTGNDRVQFFRTESAPPTTTAFGTFGTPVSRPVTVTLAAVDASSGVADVRYRLGSGPERSYTGPFVVSAEGTTTLAFYSIDRSGNVEATSTRDIVIDMTAPSGTVVFAGGVSSIGTTSVSVESSMPDAVTMRFDAGQGYGPTMAYAKLATSTAAGEGTCTVTAQYFDSAGNTATVVSQPILVDLSAPSLTVTGAPASGVTSRTVTLVVVGTDGLSGVSHGIVRVDGGSAQQYTAPVVFSAEGTHSLEAWAVDRVGNVSQPVIVTFRIDKTPPTGTVTLASGASYVATTSVGLSVTAPDAVEMSVDTGSGFRPPVPFSANSTVTFEPHDGRHTVTVRLYDEAGNMSPGITDDVEVDTAAPLTDVFGLPASGLSAVPVQLSLRARDDRHGFPGSGVDVIRFTLDSGAPLTYTETFTVSSEGLHTLQYHATDRLGWREPTGTVTFTVDLTPPTLAFEGAPASGVTSSNVSVSAVASDAHSGVEFTRISVDGGAEATYTGPVLLTSEGTHTVTGYSVDRVGRRGATAAVVFAIDRTPPSGAVTLADGAAYIGSTSTTLSIDAVADGMRIDTGAGYGPVQPFATRLPVTLDGEGLHTVRVQLLDAAGNSTVLTDTVVVDLTPPSSTLTGMPRGGLTARDVEFSLAATDGASGVAEIRYSLNGAPEQSYVSTIAVTAEGTTTLTYRAIDWVGNVESMVSTTVVIDRTAPSGELRVAGGREFVNSTLISVQSLMVAAVDMAFEIDGVMGPWMPYSAETTIEVLGEGLHRVTGVYRSRTGVTVYEQTDVRVDLGAPVATTPSAVVRALVPLGAGVWRFDTQFAWSATDPGGMSSGIALHERRFGSVVSTASASGFSAGLRAPGQSLAVRAVDQAGNASPWTSRHVRVGVLARARVPASAAPRIPFTTTAAFRAPQSERIMLRCYARDSRGRYRLAATFPGKAMKKSGAWVLVARPSLTAGRWLLVFEAAGASRSDLGLPSSIVTVR